MSKVTQVWKTTDGKTWDTKDIAEVEQLKIDNKNSEAFEKYFHTYHGRELLGKHTLDEEGVWEVRGEDPNCDMGGAHYEPHLGYFDGVLRDVVKYAIKLPSFYTWGGGGRIIKHEPKIIKIEKV